MKTKHARALIHAVGTELRIEVVFTRVHARVP
jgi:hypothetical protein